MPSFKRVAVAVVMLVVAVSAAFTVYQVADLGQGAAAQGDGQTVTNESHLQQVGMWQLVNRATNEYTTGFNDTVTVYNDSEHELTAGEDYRWNETEGTIYFENTASTTDNAGFNITYTYYANPPDVRAMDGPLDVIVEAVGRFGYLGAGLALVVLLLAFGALIAKYIGGRRSRPRTRR